MPRLEIRAEFAPSTLDVDKRSVQLTWTTGARVLRGFWDPYYEELSLEPKHVRMERLQSGAAPLLNSHSSFDLADVIGVVDSAKLEGKRGTAVVRFDRGPQGEDAFRKVTDGILRNVSVGYRVHKLVKVEDGEGKTPVYRAEDWEPYELSMVPIGADAGAGTRAQLATNPCDFIEERTMDPEDTTTTTASDDPKPSPAVLATRAASVARIEDAKARAEEKQAAAEEALAKERLRCAGLRTIGRQGKMGEPWIEAVIEAGTSVEEARRLVLEEIAKRDGQVEIGNGLRVSAGEDERDKFVRGASAWLFERTGTRKLVEVAAKKSPELFKDVSFDPGEFRGASPIDLARASLERRGVNTRGMDRMRLVGEAFTHRGGSYQTTGDFPILLENVLGKVLLGAYAMQANTWERFCGTEQVSDFRTSNRYRTGSFPGLDVIAEHSEYKSGTVPDGAKYPLSTQRLGKMFGLSRETIINDDMGALTQVATELGKSSMRTIENAVYALLALNSGLGPTQSDAQPFFHANRSNVGTGAAISVASIDADRVVMRAQKDPSGLDYIDLNPAVLLVPDSLKGTAQVINDAQYDPDTANKLQRPNMVRGLFGDIIGTPRLAAASTRRYLFAAPGEAAAIVVVFLEGYGRGPVLESQQGWRIDGVEWKVTLYAKAQMGDPKAAVTNAGV